MSILCITDCNYREVAIIESLLLSSVEKNGDTTSKKEKELLLFYMSVYSVSVLGNRYTSQ
jgi:hypothetical protein